jgi:hypothetical protein
MERLPAFAKTFAMIGRLCWSSSARHNIFEKRRATSESPVAVQTFKTITTVCTDRRPKKYKNKKGNNILSTNDEQTDNAYGFGQFFCVG